MKEKTIYRPFDKFVLRTPLFPLEEVGSKEMMESDLFKESLYLASPELAKGNPSTDPKKKQKFDDSLLKYHSRASTRCTPFGLFAGCSVGNVGTETDINLASAQHFKRVTRLDMQYLCALIQHIERLPEVQDRLLYHPNDSLYAIGDKYRYVEYNYKKNKRIHSVVSVDRDEPLEIVLKEAAQGASLSRLASILTDEVVEYQEAEAYLLELIDAQILKSWIDPSVVGEDVLRVLLDKLSTFQLPILAPLQKIQNLLDEIDSKPLGTTLPLYDEISKIVETIGVEFEAKYLFQTDMYKPAEKAVVSAEVTKRISQLISTLARITPPQEQPQLSKFVSAFSNRYETEEMPLAVVLDRELGIGYPVTGQGGNDACPLVNDFVYPRKTSGYSMIITPLDRILLEKYTECMRANGTVVELNDDDFKDLDYKHETPDSIAVMCNLLPDDTLCVRHAGGGTGTALFGRFCHLSPEIYNLAKGVADMEQALHPDKIIAEIAHLPESRIGNIASRPVFRDYTLHYLSNFDRGVGDISIADLMVSVKEGKVVLRSKKQDKEVWPRLSCAHNFGLSFIPAYRLFCDLQMQGQTMYFGCSWNDYFQSLDYLPRICYKNIILSRQRWSLKLEEVEGFDKLADDELVARMTEVAKKRMLVNEVVIPVSDNELYIDLRVAESIRLMLTHLTKAKRLILEEFLFGEKGVVCQEGKGLANEVIFVFHK